VCFAFEKLVVLLKLLVVLVVLVAGFRDVLSSCRFCWCIFFSAKKQTMGWMPRCSAACQKRYQTLGTELNVLAVTVVAVPVAWYRLRLLQGLQGMETWKKQRKTDGNKKIKNGDGPDG